MDTATLVLDNVITKEIWRTVQYSTISEVSASLGISGYLNGICFFR